jgi:hypothetical protein
MNLSDFPAIGQPAGNPAPHFHFIGNDFWTQGLNFGLEYRF